MTDPSVHTKTIDSIASFVAEMFEFRRIDEVMRPIIWFRGHANSTWVLHPQVLRSGISPTVTTSTSEVIVEQLEKEINEQFRREAVSMLPSRLNLTETYFFAQHHGLPTRLLDWTANPLHALFFAVAELPGVDGEVISIIVDRGLILAHGDSNPRRSTMRIPPLSQRDPIIEETIGYLFDEASTPPQNPVVIPLRPDLHAGRLLHQDACFTLHMPGCSDLPASPENLRRFRIPADHKNRLLLELESLGVNRATLFRDLDNLTKQIKISWGH